MNPAIMKLIAAMIVVDSGGVNDAIGRRGEVGCLQITPAVIEDINRFQSAVRFELQNALDREMSITICRIYLGEYATAARIGREPTLEDMARIWNGGPTGWFKETTVPYWRKVSAQMLGGAR
jgi:hypothetical protein